eukprot:939862_1
MSQFWLQATNCTIKGATVTKSEQNSKWATAYGSQLLSTGKHEWKIKMVNCDAAMIGITTSAPKAADDKGQDVFWGLRNTYGYYTHNGSKIVAGEFSDYGANVKSRNEDVITVHLDLDNHTLAFSNNDTLLGVVSNNIPLKEPYRLAAC